MTKGLNVVFESSPAQLRDILVKVSLAFLHVLSSETFHQQPSAFFIRQSSVSVLFRPLVCHKNLRKPQLHPENTKL